MDRNFLIKNNLTEITGDRFIIDMMYATPENIILHPVYWEVGFGDRAYIHVDAAVRLQELAGELAAQNLKLRIRDAYRPPVAPSADSGADHGRRIVCQQTGKQSALLRYGNRLLPHRRKGTQPEIPDRNRRL